MSLCFLYHISSLEETYEALRTFEVLGIKKQPDQRVATCVTVGDTLSSPTSALKDLFQALRVNGLLNCELNKKTLAVCLSWMNCFDILIESQFKSIIFTFLSFFPQGHSPKT